MVIHLLGGTENLVMEVVFVENWQRRYDLEVKGMECLRLEVFIQNSKSFVIGIIYRPPDSSQYTDKHSQRNLWTC